MALALLFHQLKIPCLLFFFVLRLRASELPSPHPLVKAFAGDRPTGSVLPQELAGMQSADTEGRNGGSPPTMEMAVESAEEARLERQRPCEARDRPASCGRRRRRRRPGRRRGGGARLESRARREDGHARASLPALHPPLQAAGLPGSLLSLLLPRTLRSIIDSSVEIDVSIYRRTLGSVCVQCDECGHQACGGCVANLPGGPCSEWTCGGIFVPCSALDAIVSSTKVECQLDVPYHESSDHRSACPHAPCDCTEAGCGFVGPPQELAVLHSVPLRTVEYGRVSRLRVPVVSAGSGPARATAARSS
uniref:E3 ubiquitin-protein ligase n=1 Tax=Hordeum vulgare subsp. vulgare TaxID=112509 RepID=A0A8I6XJS9_HORVV